MNAESPCNAQPSPSPSGSSSERGSNGPGVPSQGVYPGVSVVGPCVDQQRLTAATLFGLGCRIVPVDCRFDAPEVLRDQLAALAPDVVLWQLGHGPATGCAHLLRLLHAGTLARTGVILTTSTPAEAIAELGTAGSRVRVLGTPYQLKDLMRCVSAAYDEAQMAGGPRPYEAILESGRGS